MFIILIIYMTCTHILKRAHVSFNLCACQQLYNKRPKTTRLETQQ